MKRVICLLFAFVPFLVVATPAHATTCVNVGSPPDSVVVCTP